MEYVPRTKRRFDKISASLENFSISSDRPSPINLESSSDEEMDEAPLSPESVEEETAAPVIVEPDDEPAVAKKIRLDGNLQKYLDRYKQHDPLHFLPKKEALKGNEIAIWQPKILVSPKNDFNMSGRIQEIDDEESDRIEEEQRARIIENEGMVDEETTTETTGIVDLNSEDHSDIGSSWSSRECSPTNICVELGDSSPTSLTNGSVTDEEMMEFE
uniref:ELM2 domain-containing protein n=1 Tax=Caenorhabditis tropicalis TaxID=1561998 RepID=A0A1I7U5P9_9PELO